MQVPRIALELHRATSEETGRYSLKALKLEREGRQCRAIATNGHWAAVTRWAIPEEAEHPNDVRKEGPFETMVSADIAKAALAALPKRSNIPCLKDAGLDETVNGTAKGELVANDLESVRRISIPIMDVSYPALDKVIPARMEPDASSMEGPAVVIGLSVEYLADIAALYKKAGAKCVRIQIKSADDAVRFDAEGACDLTVVLMPMRISN